MICILKIPESSTAVRSWQASQKIMNSAEFSYIVKEDMPTAVANIDIFAFEANGFDADPAHVVMNTEELAIPRLG